MNISPETLISDFLIVAGLSGVKVKAEDIRHELFQAPHEPPKQIPPGYMAVYSFFHGDKCLKVGKAGPNSHARYTSQHYNPASAPSTLANSICKNAEELGLADINETNVGNWIRNNTARLNILIRENTGIPVLTLLESYLQCRLKPRFEGFKSQSVE